MRAFISALIVTTALAVALPAAAQQVKFEERKPDTGREARVVPPPLHYETTKPPDHDLYPRGTQVEHDPAFIEPLSSKYETANTTGRVGVSGWTSPNTPVGSPVSGWRDVNGWFALGFSVTWGGPPPPKAAPRQ